MKIRNLPFRIWLSFTVFAGIIVTSQASGLLQPDVTVLIGQLQSPKWAERDSALLVIIRSPALLGSAAVKQELQQLLGRENQLTGKSGGGEGFGEYYAELLGAVFKIANLHDPQILKMLADGAYNPDSQFAINLADAGGATLVPIALDLMSNNDHLKRWNAIGLLSRLYEKRAENKITPVVSSKIKQSILHAISDSDPSTRIEAVRAIGRIGARDDLPALERVAASDPQMRVESGGKNRRFLVREAAQRAIDDIRKRQP